MFNSRGSWLVAGLAIGFIVGLNVAGVWPQIPVHATATHGQENFAMCTGQVEDEMEGVYLLDFITGDLRGAVLGINTRTFLTVYQHNVSADFGNVKNPKYLMISGTADVRRQMAVPIGGSVIYIAEMTSGRLACYAVPWVPGRSNFNTPLKSDFLLLDGFKFRNAPIRNNE